jgi:hypothetical protein
MKLCSNVIFRAALTHDRSLVRVSVRPPRLYSTSRALASSLALLPLTSLCPLRHCLLSVVETAPPPPRYTTAPPPSSCLSGRVHNYLACLLPRTLASSLALLLPSPSLCPLRHRMPTAHGRRHPRRLATPPPAAPNLLYSCRR